jgi:hypothetical protein
MSLASVATLLVLAVATPVSAAAQLPGQFLGDAYGSKANATAGQLKTKMGRSAYQPCPCHGTDGQVRSNNVGKVDAGDPYRSGKVVSTVVAEKRSQMRAYEQTTSHVANVSALGGLITADSMDAVATVRANSTSIDPSHAGSAITGLKVNGQSRTIDPGQRIDLPGFGYVVFYNVDNFGDGTNVAGTDVDMMRIVITRNNSLDIPVGAVITTAHARAGYTRRDTATAVGAAAWGSSANSSSDRVDGDLGRTAAAYLGCFAKGTSSGTNKINGTTYPGLISTGQTVSHVYGKVSSDVALAQSRSRIEDVNLLDGLVTADVIQGASESKVNASGGHTSFDGSKFVNLQIMGQPVGDNVAPNTTYGLPGLGSITLFATDASSTVDTARATVNMVVLHVTSTNDLGVPVGTDIKLAHARTEAQP